MALIILYPLGWLFAILRLNEIFWSLDTRKILFSDKFLLWIIYLVPLGKLVYFNVPGLMGFKFCFLIWSIGCIFYLMSWFALKKFNYRTFILVLFYALIPIISILSRGNFHEILYYSVDQQTDSLGARLISLIFLMMFSVAVCDLCKRQGYEIVIKYFLNGVITATLIGCVIFLLVFIGLIGVPELEPISADSHIVNIIYRFNPGSNVNEFGLIATYALMLVQVGYPRLSRKKKIAVYGLLSFALFFSLTRATWLAYAAALVIMSMISGQGRKYLMFGTLVFTLTVFLVYQLGDDFSEVVISRFAIDGGASGDERLEKVSNAFLSDSKSILQLVLGHGWATNLYMHSVPLQLIYEIGLLGFILISSSMFWIFIKLYIRARGNVHGALPILGCLISFSIASAFHHTIYHMQTWLIVGLAIYLSFSPIIASNSKKSNI